MIFGGFLQHWLAHSWNANRRVLAPVEHAKSHITLENVVREIRIMHRDPKRTFGY